MPVTVPTDMSGLEEAARKKVTVPTGASSLKNPVGAPDVVKVLETWRLTRAETARLFGVSRQAIGKWRRRGVPPERAEAIADLAAATGLLVRHLRRDRIPAVVRRPIPARGDTSLVALLGRGDTRAVLAACRDMFRFDHAQA